MECRRDSLVSRKAVVVLWVQPPSLPRNYDTKIDQSLSQSVHCNPSNTCDDLQR